MRVAMMDGKGNDEGRVSKTFDSLRVKKHGPLIKWESDGGNMESGASAFESAFSTHAVSSMQAVCK